MKTLIGAFAVCTGLADAVALSSARGSSVARSRLAALSAPDQAFFLQKRDVPPTEVQQEVERMMQRIELLPEGHDKAEYVNQLVGVEEALAERTGAAGKFVSMNLVDEIASSRTTLCMDQGFERHETVDCETFMRVVCSLQGKPSEKEEDLRFAPVAKVPPVSAEKCHSFFQEAQREEEAGTAGASGEEAALAAAEEEQDQRGLEGDSQFTTDAAANGTNGSNGSSAMFFGGKKNRELPEQGYNEYEDGVLVKHPDLHTHVSNWLHEGEGRDISVICKEFPDNEWCQLHTQRGGDEPDSSSLQDGSDVPPLPPAPAPPPYVAPPSSGDGSDADKRPAEKAGAVGTAPRAVAVFTVALAAMWMQLA